MMLIYCPCVDYLVITILLFIVGALCGGHVLCFVLAKQNCQPHYQGTVLGFINAVVMMSGLLFQPLLGYMLDLSWDGLVGSNSLPIYQPIDYQRAFIAIVFSYALAGILILKARKWDT